MAYMKIWGPADQVLLQCDDFWIKIGLCGKLPRQLQPFSSFAWRTKKRISTIHLGGQRVTEYCSHLHEKSSKKMLAVFFFLHVF